MLSVFFQHQHAGPVYGYGHGIHREGAGFVEHQLPDVQPHVPHGLHVCSVGLYADLRGVPGSHVLPRQHVIRIAAAGGGGAVVEPELEHVHVLRGGRAAVIDAFPGAGLRLVVQVKVAARREIIADAVVRYPFQVAAVAMRTGAERALGAACEYRYIAA